MLWYLELGSFRWVFSKKKLQRIMQGFKGNIFQTLLKYEISKTNKRAPSGNKLKYFFFTWLFKLVPPNILSVTEFC